MDLDISMRTVDCFYTVTFYGALFREVLSWWMAGGLHGTCTARAPAIALKALNCPKPPLLSSAHLGCLRCCHDLKSKACLHQTMLSRFRSSLAWQVPKHVVHGPDRLWGRPSKGAIAGSFGGTGTSVPITIQCRACVLVVWPTVAAWQGPWLALCGRSSVCLSIRPHLSLQLPGISREFPLNCFFSVHRAMCGSAWS